MAFKCKTPSYLYKILLYQNLTINMWHTTKKVNCLTLCTYILESYTYLSFAIPYSTGYFQAEIHLMGRKGHGEKQKRERRWKAKKYEKNEENQSLLSAKF